MFFDAEISEMVRKAVAEGRYDLLYVMVPAMDGGQTYEMKCKICGEFGNILASISNAMAMQAQPITLTSRSGELHVLSSFAIAIPASPIGMVAKTISLRPSPR